MNRLQIETELEEAKARLSLYLQQEAKMMTGGVQSYGIGSRNLSRYNIDLASLRKAIKELKDDIKNLEAKLEGRKTRKAVGIIPRDI